MLINLYDTDVTIQSGDGIAAHDTELTDLIVNLDTSKYTSYWLYWINWDKVSLPGNFRSFYFELSSSKISAVNTTPAQNIAASFLSRRYNQTIPTLSHYQTTDFLVGQSEFTELTNLNSNSRFYNNYCILKSAAQFVVPTQHMPFVIFAEGDNIHTCYASEPGTSQFTSQQFYDFMMNGEDLTFTITGWYNKGDDNYLFDPVEFTINREDFQGGICTITKNILENEHWNSYTFTIFVGDYGIDPGRDINVLGALSSYTTPTPCLLIKENGEVHLRAAAGASLIKNPAHAYENYVSYNLQNNTITTVESTMYIASQQGPYNTHCYAGGLEFEVEKDDLDRMADYSFQTYGNAFIYRGLGNSFRIYRPIPLEEIETHINLYNRFIVDDSEITTIEFEFSDDYGVPFVDPTDQLMDELHIGNYETIGEDLRPWQEGYFNESKLDPNNDIPDYKPDESDDPTGPPNGGISGDGFTKGVFYTLPQQKFINYGAFDTNALEALNQLLWNKPDSFFERCAAAQKVNPMDYFISLRYYPIDFTTAHGEQKTELFLGRGGEIGSASMDYIHLNKQYFVANFGTLSIKPYYNNFLDYAPYTKIYINLPFCGQVELNSTIIMGTDVTLIAHIDLTDGSIYWVISVDKGNESFPLLTKQGKIGADVPITGLNASQMGANIANASLRIANNALNLPGQVLGGAKQTAEGLYSGKIGDVGSGLKTLGGVGLQVLGDAYAMGMASKEIVEKMGPSTGYACLQNEINKTPLLIYQRPIQKNPEAYGHTIGYLVNKQASIKDLEGFTVCKNPDLSGISSATDKERIEIKNLLESGFYA